MEQYEFEFFSENLKQLIKKNNIRNIDLASHLGMSKGAISNYIYGNSMPNMKTIAKIASFFDVSYDELIGRNIDAASASLNEEGKLVYTLPLFQKMLSNTEIIYRSENYVGKITSPLPFYEDLECYASLIYDNSMLSYGIAKGFTVVFSAAQEVKSGEIAAVLLKSKKQIFIRLVEFDNKKITLISDDDSQTYKKSKSGCDAIILGKILIATFDPNNKKTQ